jgi:hypothetical protein
MAAIANEIERGNAVIIAGNSFAVDDAGARAQACQRLDDQREAMGEVVARTTIERYLRAGLRAMMRKPSCLISCSWAGVISTSPSKARILLLRVLSVMARREVGMRCGRPRPPWRAGALTRSAPCLICAPVSSHPFEPSASYCVVGWSPALLRMLFFKGR